MIFSFLHIGTYADQHTSHPSARWWNEAYGQCSYYAVHASNLLTVPYVNAS